MRPLSPPSRKKDWKRYGIIIGIFAVIAIVVGFLAFSNVFDTNRSQAMEGRKLHFSQFKLTKEKITSDENALLKLKIVNPENKFYSDVQIQLAAKAPEIRMDSTNTIVRENYSEISNRNGNILTVNTPMGLGEGEETRLYSFYIGKDLEPGTVRTTLKIEVRAIGDGEILDNRSFQLTITSKK